MLLQSAIVIRSINITDAAYTGVWHLREEVLRKPLGLSLRDEDLSGESTEIILAAFAEDDAVVGCILMRRISTAEVKLRQMAVATALQGAGIGRTLLQQAEETARAAGYKLIALHARQTAVPFYKGADYTISGDVFTEAGIPHLLMNKRLHEAL